MNAQRNSKNDRHEQPQRNPKDRQGGLLGGGVYKIYRDRGGSGGDAKARYKYYHTDVVFFLEGNVQISERIGDQKSKYSQYHIQRPFAVYWQHNCCY